MKIYIVEIDDDLSLLFEGVAKAAQRSVEEVLADTVYKMADIILRGIDED